jgi:hypothetical protein
MAKSATSDIIKLTNVRLSYPKLAKPEQFRKGEGRPRYSATFLLDPSDAEHAKQIAEIKAATAKIMKEAYGEVLKGLALCWGDGNKQTNEKGEIKDGYKDMFYVRTSCDENRKPLVINRSRVVVTEGDAQYPYAGCYVNTNITLWAQNNEYGKKINGNLRIVQFVRDGEPFGAGPINIEDEFEAMENNAAADEFGDGEVDPFA